MYVHNNIVFAITTKIYNNLKSHKIQIFYMIKFKYFIIYVIT